MFAARFISAAQHARDLARGFVLEALPEPMLFRVLLNKSNDDIEPLRPVRWCFPLDSAAHRVSSLARLRGADDSQ